ncbi:MAG TPA: hypothetical protein VFD03_07740, partial [Clostridia bacterium]|nr:hypothetical protein [Clostridia bacterium]
NNRKREVSELFIIFILIVIAVVVYFRNENPSSTCCMSKSNDAEILLKQRYINGEIDEDTYNKMMRIIRS